MVKETTYYDILDIKPNCTQDEIEKAFRNLQIRYIYENPAENEEYRQVYLAGEVLSDPVKRTTYDIGGEQAVKEIFPKHYEFSSPDDMPINGTASSSTSREPKRATDIFHQLSVTLEELYNGVYRKLEFTKSVICPNCKGVGHLNHPSYCQNCQGIGKFFMNKIKTGVMRRIELPCSQCNGKGKIADVSVRCKICSGNKVNKQTKILEVHIRKGMESGDKIVFRGAGNQDIGLEPGDIIIVLKEEKHEIFKRDGADLVMVIELNLLEALGGFKRAISTLDGRTLRITSSEGKVTKHGETKCIRLEGMPTCALKGNLYIQFLVLFPECIHQDTAKQIEMVLPPKPMVIIPEDAENVDLIDRLGKSK